MAIGRLSCGHRNRGIQSADAKPVSRFVNEFAGWRNIADRCKVEMIDNVARYMRKLMPEGINSLSYAKIVIPPPPPEVYNYYITTYTRRSVTLDACGLRKPPRARLVHIPYMLAPQSDPGRL